MSDLGIWTVHDQERPRSLNAERSMHHMAARRLTAADRERWGWLWRKAGLGRATLGKVSVEAFPTYAHHPQDAGNCLPSVKAAIDALEDIGAIEDDGPAFVLGVLLHAPDLTVKTNGLTVMVRQEPAVRVDLAGLAAVLDGLVPLAWAGYGERGGDRSVLERAEVALASLEFARC